MRADEEATPFPVAMDAQPIGAQRTGLTEQHVPHEIHERIVASFAVELVVRKQRCVEELVGARMAAHQCEAAGLHNAAVHNEIAVAAVFQRAEGGARREHTLHVLGIVSIQALVGGHNERNGETGPGRI